MIDQAGSAAASARCCSRAPARLIVALADSCSSGSAAPGAACRRSWSPGRPGRARSSAWRASARGLRGAAPRRARPRSARRSRPGHGLDGRDARRGESSPIPSPQEFRDVIEEVRLGLPCATRSTTWPSACGTRPAAPGWSASSPRRRSAATSPRCSTTSATPSASAPSSSASVQVLTAQGRLSGGVLTALPFLVGARCRCSTRTTSRR